MVLNTLTADLNPAQLEAVTTTDGPLLVVAGAGSGKTRVLTHRIAHLIRDKDVSPYEILAITFTNKAANEMRERVADLVGGMVDAMWVSTFHRACVRILRREATRLGYNASFSIYDDADSRRLIKYCLNDLNLDNKRFPPRNIQAAISNAKNELIDYESFAGQEGGFFHEKIAEVYRLYQQRLLEASAMDFDDLLMITVELMGAFPDVLERYQNRFRFIHVDEYQDTNHAQYRLVNLLAEQHKNVCVVGDSDQSIYAFRGADIRNILEFERDYPDARKVVLDQNYRSTQNILDAANAVISNNSGRNDKHLWSDRGEGEKLVRYQAQDERDEAAFVAEEIESLMTLRSADDISVFYRTNAQSRVVEEVFVRYGIPYRVVGGTRFYERREVKDILSYLRVAVNPGDQVAVKRIINAPKRGIGDTTVGHVDRYAEAGGITFFEALKEADDITSLNGRAIARIKEFVGLIDYLKDRADDGPAGALQAIIEDSGYLEWVESERTIEALGRAENIKEVVASSIDFEETQMGTTNEEGVLWSELTGHQRVEAFLESVSLVADVDSLDGQSGAVTLMTLHNAKGLEYPAVFMVGLEDGVFPHMRSLGDPAELEEERRLFYVGITRAQEHLYLLNATSRTLFGGTNFNSVSRLLKEIPDTLTSKRSRTRNPATESPHRSTVSASDIAAGDVVHHEYWGKGRVREIRGEGDGAEAVVVFDNEGPKTLLLAWAPLKKA
ncbi:MAG: DNA helicase PcrA [Acidimicrobiia bacterium]|nr:DNA helicase PcrA [Acidimicrobiia bacterium]NNL28045.1 DNA helicase PcrA [Acidimicrobiia bacterium]